ncbi:MAG: hypothetical protein Q6I77_07815, partial [Gloeomargarita sp. DG_1_4_bins_134]
DPEHQELNIFVRSDRELREIGEVNGWESPRLGIRFELNPDELALYYPNGERFKTTVELANELQTERQRAMQAMQRAEAERQRAIQEAQRAEAERQRAEQERQRAERLAEYLRSQGVNPEQI